MELNFLYQWVGRLIGQALDVPTMLIIIQRQPIGHIRQPMKVYQRDGRGSNQTNMEFIILSKS